MLPGRSRPRPIALAVVASAVFASACSGIDDQISQLRSTADGAVDRVQFCLAVTRALAAVDGGTTPEQARSAAEEVLAQVPAELREDAELVAARLREAAENGDRSVLDADFEAAARDLRDDTTQMCDPRG